VRWNLNFYIIGYPDGPHVDMKWFRRLVAEILKLRVVFNPQSIHVRFLEDKVTTGQALPKHFPLPLLVFFHLYYILFTVYSNQNEKRAKLFRKSGTTGEKRFLFIYFYFLKVFRGEKNILSPGTHYVNTRMQTFWK
jgi:hypothetical protein